MANKLAPIVKFGILLTSLGIGIWDAPFWNVLVLYGNCPNSFRPPGPLSNGQTCKKLPKTILASLYTPHPPYNTFKKGTSLTLLMCTTKEPKEFANHPARSQLPSAGSAMWTLSWIFSIIKIIRSLSDHHHWDQIWYMLPNRQCGSARPSGGRVVGGQNAWPGKVKTYQV